MITSRSFDYDNILSRRACSHTTNTVSIRSRQEKKRRKRKRKKCLSKYLFISEDQKSYFSLFVNDKFNWSFVRSISLPLFFPYQHHYHHRLIQIEWLSSPISWHVVSSWLLYRSHRINVPSLIKLRPMSQFDVMIHLCKLKRRRKRRKEKKWTDFDINCEKHCRSMIIVGVDQCSFLSLCISNRSKRRWNTIRKDAHDVSWHHHVTNHWFSFFILFMLR